jgi:hypothetical protein
MGDRNCRRPKEKEVAIMTTNTARPLTLEQLRADLDARKAMAQRIAEAFRRGDMAGVEAAQAAMRKAFPERLDHDHHHRGGW